MALRLYREASGSVQLQSASLELFWREGTMTTEVTITMTDEDVVSYRANSDTKRKWLEYARKAGREHDANVVTLNGPDGVVGTVKLHSGKKR